MISLGARARILVRGSLLCSALILVCGVASGQDYLGERPEVVYSTADAQSLKRKSDELGDAVAIFEFVRNEYRFVLYHGSRSNSVNTFSASRANDVDLASLLVAMLRSQGIQARYASAQIQLPFDRLLGWLGVEDIEVAYRLMEDRGIPGLARHGNESVEFEHAWVQARVHWDDYRGLPGHAVDCISAPEECRWVDLDPSFKKLKYASGLLDLEDDVVFDYRAYYHALDETYAQPDAVERRGKNPIDIYEEQVLAHLRGRGLGEDLQNVRRDGSIEEQAFGVLPASLPYEVVGAPSYFASVSDQSLAGGRVWEKRVDLTVKLGIGDGTVIVPAGSILLAEASTKRLSIAYEPGDPARVVTRLEGRPDPISVPVVIGETEFGGVKIYEGFPYLGVDVQLELPDGSFDTYSYTGHLVGDHIVIVIGDNSSNQVGVDRAAEKLLEANDTYPIVLDGSDQPFVDENTNGVADAGDMALLDHADAMSALNDGLLEVVARQAAHKIAIYQERIDALFHTANAYRFSVILASNVMEVEYIDETPFAILPGGLYVDVGASSAESLKATGPITASEPALELRGHAASAMEYEVWTELLGYDAVSTVNGIQKALAQGADLLEIEVSESVDEMLGAYASFGFQSAIPAEYTATQYTFAGNTIWGLRPGTGAKDLQMMRAVLQGDEPDSVKTAYEVTADLAESLDGFLQSWQDGEDQLQSMIQNGQVFVTPTQLCDESPSSIYPSVLLSWVGPCYEFTVNEMSSTAQWLLEHLDADSGMSLTSNVYRQIPLDDPLKQSLSTIYNVRFFAYEAYAGSPPGRFARIVIPDQATVGPTYRFDVMIVLAAEGAISLDNDWTQRFEISNTWGVANGGWTDGSTPIDPVSDLVSYDNEVFTDDNLVAASNNDSVIAPSTADPIAVATGNMYHDEVDFVIKSVGPNISLSRTYNSRTPDLASGVSPLGPGWTHSYLMRLEARDAGRHPDDASDSVNTDGLVNSVVYRDERGGESSYIVDPTTGTIEPPTGTHHELVLEVSPGIHELRFRTGVVFEFEGPDMTAPGDDARLRRILDPFGNVIQLTYNAQGELFNINDSVGISDPLSRGGVNLIHVGGLLRTVVDWTGRVWQYTYDSEGRLETVTDGEGLKSTYSYDLQGNLASVTKPEDRNGDGVEGDVRTAFSYYRNRRAFGNENGLGFGESVSYDYLAGRTRVVGPRGFVREYHFDRSGLLEKLVEPDGGVALFDHTDDHHRFKRTDALGYVTEYSYHLDRSIGSHGSDTYGNVTLERDALGGEVETDYDFDLYDQIVRRKDADGGVTNYVYYAVDDPSIGAVRGRLHYVELETLGDASNVRLREMKYNPNGTIDEVYEYIEAGNLVRRRTTKYIYSPNGLDLDELLVEGTDGTRRRMTFEYDDLGRLTKETLWRRAEPTGPVTPPLEELVPISTTYGLDSRGRVTSVTDAIGNSRIFEYDRNDQVREVRVCYRKPDDSCEIRVIEQRFYDEADRLIRIVDPRNGAESTQAFDEAGNLVKVVDPMGEMAILEYDEMGRQTGAIDGDGHRNAAIYDHAGRVREAIDGNGHSTWMEYDALGRLSSEIDAEGNRARYEYYPGGRLKKSINARGDADPSLLNSYGASVYYEYDELHRLVRTVDALDHENLFEYDLRGNRTKITDAKSQVTEFVFDDLGRLTEIRDPIRESPVDKVEQFWADEAGNVYREIDRRGVELLVTYDSLNRVDLREYPGEGVVEDYSYDFYGNLDTLVSPEVSYSFGYDDLDRMDEKTDLRSGRSIEFGYDLAGRLSSKTDYQGNTTSYQYSASGRIVSQSNPGYLQISYHYDGAGRLLDRVLSNGSWTRYGYDDANRLTSLVSYSADGAVVDSATYVRDAVGHVERIVRAEGETVFGYDAAQRLRSADYPGATPDRSFTYDSVGNRLTKVVGSESQTYIYSTGNRLDEIRRTSDLALLERFEYDDNGAMVRRFDGQGGLELELTRDFKGRVVATQSGAGASAYGYDARDMRVRVDDPSGSHLHHLDGEQTLSIYDDDGSVEARFMPGAVIDEIVNGYWLDPAAGGMGEASYIYHHDHINSVAAISGHAGAVEEVISYSPFGEELNTTGDSVSNLRFTGREIDVVTGLYYFRARYYDPSIGRFLSEDPLGFQAGMNFYAYASNSPVSVNDPLGLADYYWTVGDPTPIVENVDEPGINDFLEGFGGPIARHDTFFYPTPQDIVSYLDKHGFNAAWPEHTTASMIDGIVMRDGGPTMTDSVHWIINGLEFAINSPDQRQYDYKYGKPFSPGDYYVFDGEAYTYDYAGNVAWAAAGSSRYIFGSWLKLGAYLQGLTAGGEDPWDQLAIDRGVNWIPSGLNFTPWAPPAHLDYTPAGLSDGCGFCPAGPQYGPGPWDPVKGGYVIYPNKVNTSGLRRAYFK